MYSSGFSRIYDLFGWNYYPEAFHEQLTELIADRDVKSCLDIGCGTGVLCALLSKDGIETVGIDLSEGMIAIAREHCPDNDFRVADMVSFRCERTFDLITCTGDALNHLSDPVDVLKVFRNVYAMLAPGGLFVFDVLSGREIDTDGPIEFDYDEHTRGSFSMARTGERGIELRVRAWKDGMQTVDETIRESLFMPGEIHAMLGEAGFAGVRQRYDLLDRENADSTTVYYLAEHP